MGSQNGLTLMEVMIALLIFTIGILAVAGMQISSLRSGAEAGRALYDTLAASIQLEEILSQPYDHPSLQDVDNGYNVGAPDHGPFILQPSGSTVEWEVQDGFPTLGSKRITVTIRCSGSSGQQRSYTYDYLKAKLNL
jgi:prepilin-type N-terminal cleavage/methylation domain-containing protein